MKDSFARVAMLLIIVGLMFAWIMKPIESPIPASSPSKMTTFKDGFMEGCYEPELKGSFTYCECVYDYLDRNLTDKGMSDMAIEYAETEEAPEIMNSAAKSCL